MCIPKNRKLKKILRRRQRFFMYIGLDAHDFHVQDIKTLIFSLFLLLQKYKIILNTIINKQCSHIKFF